MGVDGHRRLVWRCAVVAVVLTAAAVSAGAQGHTDRAAFLAALPGPPETFGFDALPFGMTIAAGTTTGGIGFAYDFGGAALKVTGLYPAVSAPHALGSTDADILQDGDDLALSFAATHAIGLSIITREVLEDDDLVLTAGGQRIGVRGPAIQQVLADGSNVYFLGVVSPSRAFDSATLTTTGGGYFFYNLDDIVRATAADSDADGIADSADNCILHPNGPLAPDAGGHSQRDSDGDGYGNACDADFNDDGMVNFADLAVFRTVFASADADADLNGDGIVNFADLAMFRQLFAKPPGPSMNH